MKKDYSDNRIRGWKKGVAIAMGGLAALAGSAGLGGCAEGDLGPIVVWNYPNGKSDVSVNLDSWKIIKENDKEYVFQYNSHGILPGAITKISKQRLRERYGTDDLTEIDKIGDEKRDFLSRVGKGLEF